MNNISINSVDSRSYLQIGKEMVEISDYKVKSSADGSTELTVTITGLCSEFALSANLKELMQ